MMRPPCLFGCVESVGQFHLPKGCIVKPDTEQDLCWQHAGRARDQGAYSGIALLKDYTDGWFTKWWNGE